MPEALDTLESDAVVTVTQDPRLTFTPTERNSIGFIFYPGGRVAPDGYSPLLRVIAAEGYLVVVPEMPLNIAAFRPNVADKIIAAYPEIEQWVIGGHSVGGAMAAQTVTVRIEGGDHHQCGAYIIKPEEHLATVSPEVQHEQIVQATLELLASVEQGSAYQGVIFSYRFAV